ncbi:cobalt ECF transporter T component CbiQ [Butyrivibrio sp. INlla21]|uniref:cobalt ECF transporter T component CbiQ n=1 Tax=Butyrivibrio sp. INlla21 TaxID=1520811 RepID=UPI0008EDB06A|nr:cobalt ECF transporter T component CbiQ [Butyrivibrio sp. INlla21]SFU53370.1 cobalt/nickel transport system permease protein [Butyrivibrio sp. INlla21]
MNSIEKRLVELNKLQDLQQRSHWMNNLHPLGKLLISVIYIFLVTSVGKYDIVPLILLSVYIIFTFIIGELSFKDGIYRMRLILPLVLFVGIFNPFLDKTTVMIAGYSVSGGMVSMLTLMIKGLYTVLAVYALIATTSIDDICYALRTVKVPKIIVIVIMLIYRYIDVMSNEADRIYTAYRLRAPGQKGIEYRSWGTLVGQWLLRSMDKARIVYESMHLRGFKGDFIPKKKGVKKIDVIYPIVWVLILLFIRFYAGRGVL